VDPKLSPPDGARSCYVPATVRAVEQPLPESIGGRASGWRWLVLAAVILVTTVARVWVIRHYPEPDGDAKGHLGIATALLSDPLNVSLHWVWPPGYHFYLAGLLAVGFTAEGIRLLDCGLAALLPVLVWRYAERTLEPSATGPARLVPFLAGVLCAAMPIVNLLGTSAQQETLFTILVLATAWSIDARRFAVGGGLLAAATMVRYEACGAAFLLAGLCAVGSFPALVRRLPAPIARACRLPPVVAVPSIVTIGAWFLAHRVSDGTWFGFLRELHRYTHEQRLSFHQDRFTDLVWFPILQPYYLFGLTLLLFFLGARRAWRAGSTVPLGIYLFLLASYASKSALGSGRYYESLAPFVCIAAAHGAAVIGERRRWVMPLAYGAALAHVAWLLVLTGRWTFHV
jgi:hypothetical protein